MSAAEVAVKQAPAEPLSLRLASKLFELESGQPQRRSLLVLRIVCVLVAVLLVWALVAKLDIVAVAQGRLVPQTYVKIVQPAEAGIVREILVREGDAVEAGQVLVRLDPTVNAADSGATSRELALQKLQLRRTEVQLANRPLKRNADEDPNLFLQVEAQSAAHRQQYADAVAQETAARARTSNELQAARELLSKLEQTLPSYLRSAEAYEKLAKDNLVGTLQAEERRREALEKAQDLQSQRASVLALQASIEQHDQRLAQLRSAYSAELNNLRLQAVTAINRLEQQLGKLNFQQGLLELRAPQAGVVKELATTTVGAVVQPGTVLASLVPRDEPLLAEVLIENKDIGFVRPGQSVRLKVAAYTFQKYGMLEGVVKSVSADSSARGAESGTQGPEAGLSFKALIELKEQKLAANDLHLPLAAGMQLSAEIMQGRRSVMEYLLSPVQRVVSEAGMER
jgi:HlyD family secretion protein